ncbi:VP39 [Epinotia aporema granulovirus]|uniref:VP39 n=1 Tax=Epinotia aporema granulovirus TaxID=166056 RepID=K4EQF1_9BBAC|nr:VP39 [Epinotia aporema granulovirus]AER41518.1 VP39 [Epinotia aporema granulovirus]
MDYDLNTFNLRNLCIFQMLYNNYMCDALDSPCTTDAQNDDGTFICEGHLERYFKIGKMVLEIPSGTGQSFKILVGKTLVQQKDNRRVMIPYKKNYHELLNVESMSTMEKFILHTIYEDQEKITDLCTRLKNNELHDNELWTNLGSVVSQIMSRVMPNYLCRQEVSTDTRVFDASTGGDNALTVNTRYEEFPPFLKNLIRMLVRPITLNIGSEQLILEREATVSFSANGLSAPVLYNPVKPRFLLNPQREPRFQMRTVVEFDGRATRQQQALARYEVYTIARPMLAGTETVPNV